MSSKTFSQHPNRPEAFMDRIDADDWWFEIVKCAWMNEDRSAPDLIPRLVRQTRSLESNSDTTDGVPPLEERRGGRRESIGAHDAAREQEQEQER
jgi:hypothetical protein